MSRNLIKYLLLMLLPGLCISQDKEKSIVNQSLLIDAIREEQIGHKEKAIEILEKLKYEPETKGVSNFYLAKLYRSMNKMDEAFDAIDQSIQAEPSNPWYLIMKTNLTQEYGRNQETAETFEKLCNVEPNNLSHYDNAAYFFLKAEDLPKALEILSKAEQIFGLIPTIEIKKSYVLTLQKKNKEAQVVLENALHQYPSNKDLVVELIKFHLESGNQDQASVYVEKLKQLDPNNEELKNWTLKKAADSDLQLNKSTDDVMQSTELNLDDKIKFLLVKLNAFIKKSDKAGILSLLTPASQLKKQFPSEPKTSALLGDLHFQLNDLLSAKEAYIQAIRDGNVPFTVYDNLLFCLIHLNHWKTANAYAQKCMDLYPNQSFPNYVFILSKYKLNQLENILSTVEQMELMVNYNDHKKTEVLILKAKILSQLSQEDESNKTWKQALDLDHDYLAALEYCVFLASKGTAYPKDYFEKAMNSEFIQESFKLDKAAQLFCNTKEYQKAKEYIDSCISKGYCESTDSLLLAAKIYDALGLTKLAQEFKDKAKHLLESESSSNLQTSKPLK